MHTIVPAIIPQSLEHLRNMLKIVEPFTREVQIDVVDGIFVPFVSWPYGKGEKQGEPSALASLTRDHTIELDLMIKNALIELPKWLEAGVKRAIIHIESCPDVARARDIARAHGALLGVSSNNDTPLELFLLSLIHADYAQCMGIAKIGSQGQPFDETVLSRIKAVHEKFPNMEIAVDGGVDTETAGSLLHAGATRLISGSAILNAPDPKVAYEMLRAASNPL